MQCKRNDLVKLREDYGSFKKGDAGVIESIIQDIAIVWRKGILVERASYYIPVHKLVPINRREKDTVYTVVRISSHPFDPVIHCLSKDSLELFWEKELELFTPNSIIMDLGYSTEDLDRIEKLNHV